MPWQARCTLRDISCVAAPCSSTADAMVADISESFSIVPLTISFRLLYGLLLLHHDRRQVLWPGVTAHPTAEWISHQLTEAYGWKVAPRYIIRDRDAVYGDVFTRRLRAMSIRDRPTAPRSPWQNGYCERAIGSIRQECLDHVVVFGERHLRHLLRSYATYYNEARTHLSVNKDAPIAANSTCCWPHFAYAISRRTSSSVRTSLKFRQAKPLLGSCS